jgi:hypothetical protein
MNSETAKVGATDSAMDRVTSELLRALDHTRAELDSIELLSAALSAFTQPVPDYEPRFQHVHGLALTRHEIN